ncbi:hypothetical protein [Bartonella sp. AU18XJBT]|uniref:hypothetical protein n=1 Tax=Bartonella sp. AU18XJBT TaxID=3019089 RepID=UPI00236146D2|nr:hypothetical protein [Bartonella sp. AU18XJBT]
MKYCILWGHSPAHAFSCRLSERLDLLPKLPWGVCVVGSNAEDKIISGCAHRNKIDSASVKLGRKRQPMAGGGQQEKCL